MTRPTVGSRVLVELSAVETVVGYIVWRSEDARLPRYVKVAVGDGETLALFDHHVQVVNERPALRLVAKDGAMA